MVLQVSAAGIQPVSAPHSCLRIISLHYSYLQMKNGPLLKLCDFGYSKSQDMSLPKSLVGTTQCELT